MILQFEYLEVAQESQLYMKCSVEMWDIWSGIKNGKKRLYGGKYEKMNEK
jgi:hypothetical protein